MELFEGDLAAFGDDWRLADLAESTLRAYTVTLRKYERWCTAQGVQTLSMRAAKGYLVEVRGHSVSNAYMVSRALKAFGRWYAKEYSEPDPFAQLAYASQPKPVPQRTTTVADVAALLMVCGDDIRGLRDRALIHVLATSGMRRSEAASMRWGHVAVATGVVTVPVTKNGRPRTVRLSKDALRALRRYMKALDRFEADTDREPSESVWISTTRRAPLSSNGIGQMLQERSRQAGVDVTAHAFRRGFAMEWLRRGGSETYLRRIAGWESPAMVQKYTQAVAAEESLVQHERLFG